MTGHVDAAAERQAACVAELGNKRPTGQTWRDAAGPRPASFHPALDSCRALRLRGCLAANVVTWSAACWRL